MTVQGVVWLVLGATFYAVCVTGFSAPHLKRIANRAADLGGLDVSARTVAKLLLPIGVLLALAGIVTVVVGGRLGVLVAAVAVAVAVVALMVGIIRHGYRQIEAAEHKSDIGAETGLSQSGSAGRSKPR